MVSPPPYDPSKYALSWVSVPENGDISIKKWRSVAFVVHEKSTPFVDGVTTRIVSSFDAQRETVVQQLSTNFEGHIVMRPLKRASTSIVPAAKKLAKKIGDKNASKAVENDVSTQWNSSPILIHHNGKIKTLKPRFVLTMVERLITVSLMESIYKVNFQVGNVVRGKEVFHSDTEFFDNYDSYIGCKIREEIKQGEYDDMDALEDHMFE